MVYSKDLLSSFIVLLSQLEDLLSRLTGLSKFISLKNLNVLFRESDWDL